MLRGWQVDDAAAALEIYGNPDVARWLTPAIDRVPDLETMRKLLGRWIEEALTHSQRRRWNRYHRTTLNVSIKPIAAAYPYVQVSSGMFEKFIP